MWPVVTLSALRVACRITTCGHVADLGHLEGSASPPIRASARAMSASGGRGHLLPSPAHAGEGHPSMSTAKSIAEAVQKLARERPEWLVILRACCAIAKDVEATGLGFSGKWARQKLVDWGAPEAVCFPGLTLLELRGLITKAPGTAGKLHLPDAPSGRDRKSVGCRGRSWCAPGSLTGPVQPARQFPTLVGREAAPDTECLVQSRTQTLLTDRASGTNGLGHGDLYPPA